MSTRNDDRDTQEVLTDGEELSQMAQSRGWGIARGMLVEKILDLQNIHNVDEASASIDNVVIDIKSRKAAVAVLYAWLKEVEGRVEQHTNNKEMMADAPENAEGYIEIKRGK